MFEAVHSSPGQVETGSDFQQSSENEVAFLLRHFAEVVALRYCPLVEQPQALADPTAA